LQRKKSLTAFLEPLRNRSAGGLQIWLTQRREFISPKRAAREEGRRKDRRDPLGSQSEITVDQCPKGKGGSPIKKKKWKAKQPSIG